MDSALDRFVMLFFTRLPRVHTACVLHTLLGLS